MKNYLLLFVVVVLTIQTNAQTVTDIDGNMYETVTIGSQVWMKENLRTTHYRNGEVIPIDTSSIGWIGQTTGAYCNYDNDSSNVAIYGRLYNGYVVTDPREVSPIGWHVPTDTEWTTLVTYLGGVQVAGGKMKSTGTTIWMAPNTGATNISGFSSLPGGQRDFKQGAAFGSLKLGGNWWSKTTFSTSDCWARSIGNGTAEIYNWHHPMRYGFSIRCLKDGASSTNSYNCPSDKVTYPTIVKDKLYMNYTSLRTSGEIMDMQGKRVLEIVNGATQIDLSNLIKGVYLVKVVHSGTIIVEKLIKG